jgi:hypothetical protein
VLATFTYSGKETRKITKFFKDTKIKIAYRTRNDTKYSKTTPTKRQIHNSGIYQMKCLDCQLKYVGQSSRTFHTRYIEHIQAIRNNKSNLGYSNHILNGGHKCGTIADTMDIIRTHRKGKPLNILEKHYVYKVSKDNLQMNDMNTDTHNQIFKTLHETNTR